MATSYEPLFGELLQEPHPTRTLVIQGRQVPCPHYSVCWSALERYQPLSAEALAARRASRQHNRAERVEKKWLQDNPLLAWAETVHQEEKGQDGSPNHQR